ncbi:PD40 domain-containing protein [bacterium]|nr:PD40 domain-containing protein [bacterium]
MLRLSKTIMAILLVAIVFFIWLGSAGSVIHAQTVSEPWETLTLEHFRMHYPATYRAWSHQIGSRLEAIHEQVTAVVEYVPAKPIDILVIDPMARANGAAMPFLNRPRMVLFASPPEATSSLNMYHNWQELLVTHEYVHLTHMLRPSRNRFYRLLGHLLPASPITLKCPMWIVEGYATLLEGKLTGMGRPNGSFRAMFIRSLAADGLMPTYNQLNMSDHWAAGAFPYLFGSSFMEWLEKRDGLASFVDLWKRMTARKNRSFRDAFSGVFQEPPDEIYGRFAAETTAQAIQLKHQIEQEGLREGTLWAKNYRNIGHPSLAPDGSLMALVTYSEDRPPKLEVWSTSEIEETKKDDQKLLERDPEDVPDKPSAPPHRKVKYTLSTHNGVSPGFPKFFPDGQRILLERYVPDSQGNVHPDLFIWELGPDRLVRVTEYADVSQAVPFHHQNKAIAVRSRFGQNQLVEVDLSSGQLVDLTEMSLEKVLCTPVLSPDDTYLAVVVHEAGHWQIQISNRETAEQKWTLGDGTEVVCQPAWSSDGTRLYFISDRTGIPNIEYLDLITGARTRITHVFTGAIAPAPGPDENSLYYLQFWSRGMSIYKMDALEAVPAEFSAKATGLFPVVPPLDLEKVPPLKSAELNSVKDYAWGRQEFSTVSSLGFGPAGDNLSYGVRMGDVLGRNETILLVGLPIFEGLKGVTFREKINRLPVEIFLQGYWAEEKPGDISEIRYDSDLLKNRESYGFMTALNWSYRNEQVHCSLGGGGLTSHIEWLDHEVAFTRSLAEITAEFSYLFGRSAFFVSPHLDARYQLGFTDGDEWNLFRGQIGLNMSPGRVVLLKTRYEYGSIQGDYHDSDIFRVGGWQTALMADYAVSERVFQPALPQAVRTGTEFDRTRLELFFPTALPVLIYGEDIRAWTDERAEADPMRLLGIELKIEVPQMAIVNLAQTELVIGYAWLFEDPLREQEEFYALMNLKP